MQKVLILKGLPASGKSTFAKDLVRRNAGVYKRVNKDDLRAMLDEGKWEPRNEKFTIKIRNRIILDSLHDGYSVIVDDTNFNPIHEQAIREMISHIDGVDVELKMFDVDVEECIKRDLKRPNSVGERVIRTMHKKYIEPGVEKITQDPKLPHAYIFDIDGTLALMDGRGPFDWKRVGEDKVNKPVKEILSLLKFAGHKIVILSGRDGICYPETEKWLAQNDIEYDLLALRQAGDNRRDSIIKRELFDNYVKGVYCIRGVFDDRDQVVQLWRSMGLQCFQVADGNF